MFFLIGHRGVGKTSLSKKIENSIDLDEVISQNHDIDKVFRDQGESDFREIEKKTLQKILEEKKVSLISLGAGFELSSFEFPEDAKFIWIQRASDRYGRIFLDRPRLDEEKTALEEFIERKLVRDKVFQKFCDFKLSLEEGDFTLERPLKIIKSLMLGKLEGESRGYFTPATSFELEVFKGAVELRTDYFDEAQILNALEKNQYSKAIVALRTQSAINEGFCIAVIDKGALVDLPLESEDSLALSEKFSKEEIFLSLHKISSLDKFNKINTKFHLKWAPELRSLKESINAFDALGDDVSFLPRSPNKSSEFKWFRLLRRNRIEFYRYGETDNLDQPLYFESFDFKRENIGAVIGENTDLSWSPVTHRTVFKNEFKSHYLNISISRDVFNTEFLEFLKTKGLRFLSVTAPFKKEFSEKTNLASCNSFDLCSGRGLDSDALAVKKWVLDSQKRGFDSFLIWGRGSMGQAFKEKFNERAILCSARAEKSGTSKSFDALIWASGTDAKLPEFVLSQKKALKAIYDLDYKEESNGRLLALKTGALYISGKEFFQIQAEAQSHFFKACFKDF